MTVAHLDEDTLIRLQHLRRLDLEPGDTLVVTAPGTSMTQAQTLEAWLREQGFVPDGVKLAVFPGGTEVGVLRPSAQSDTDEP